VKAWRSAGRKVVERAASSAALMAVSKALSLVGMKVELWVVALAVDLAAMRAT